LDSLQKLIETKGVGATVFCRIAVLDRPRSAIPTIGVFLAFRRATVGEFSAMLFVAVDNWLFVDAIEFRLFRTRKPIFGPFSLADEAPNLS
jgi:hypothetical protein